jgi:hypothetical protein
MGVFEWLWCRWTGEWDLSLGKRLKERGRPGHIRVFDMPNGAVLGAFYDPQELALWIDSAPEATPGHQNIAVQIYGPFSSRKMGRGLSDAEASELQQILEGIKDAEGDSQPNKPFSGQVGG